MNTHRVNLYESVCPCCQNVQQLIRVGDGEHVYYEFVAHQRRTVAGIRRCDGSGAQPVNEIRSHTVDVVSVR